MRSGVAAAVLVMLAPHCCNSIFTELQRSSSLVSSTHDTPLSAVIICVWHHINIVNEPSVPTAGSVSKQHTLWSVYVLQGVTISRNSNSFSHYSTGTSSGSNIIKCLQWKDRNSFMFTTRNLTPPPLQMKARMRCKSFFTMFRPYVDCIRYNINNVRSVKDLHTCDKWCNGSILE